MDNITQFIQPELFFDESLPWFPTDVQEVSKDFSEPPPDPHPDPQTTQSTPAQASQRATNTIFKTGLSIYRKITIESIKACGFDKWLRPFLNDEVGKAKNMSAFPKLLVVVKELEIEEKMSKRWQEKSSIMLEQKKSLNQKGKFSSNRMNQLQKSVKVMTRCIECQDLNEAFEIYWSGYRQAGKHQNSWNEVKSFERKLKEKMLENKIE